MKKIMPILLVLVVLLGGAGYYFLVYQAEDTGDELYSYVPGDYFVTNVKDSESLFKVTVVLMVDDEGIATELEDNEYVIRDNILIILRELTEADIKSEGIQDRLRTQIADKLNEVLGIDNIVAVYFTDFVMQ